jgi:hypothetical protein
MVYFCAWGPGCERFHDIVDQVIVEDGIGRRFVPPTPRDAVMTTWHDRESLEDALDFFATSAVATDGYGANSRYRVVISVESPEWASVATRFLKDAKFLS